VLGLTPELGIDLGTSNILVYMRGKGIIINEPSVVAMASRGRRVLAVGEDARKMLGRTPGAISAIRPLKDGVIADYTTTTEMLRYLVRKACGSRIGFSLRPRVMVCVPAGATDVERRAVLQAAREAGAKEAFPIEEPMAAAIGAGLDIDGPAGSMVVDVGGGTTDVAVISLSGIVLAETVRIGGDRMDETIAKYIKNTYSLLIGDRSAEEIKIKIGSAFPLETELRMAIRGRDMVEGLPTTIEVTSEEIREALADPVLQILDCIKAALETTPPELASDIIERGIVLTGGGALLRGLDKLVEEQTRIPTRVAEDPLSCVALGTGRALHDISALRESALASMPE
jgi:rod shape-determining protein MreB